MKNNRKSQKAFSLIEVVLALGVTAFCLLPLMALVPLGLNASQDADAQVRAASLLKAVAADLKSTPLAASNTTVTKSPFFGFKVSDTTGTVLYVDENGGFDDSLSASSRYRVTVSTVDQPANATDRRVTLLRVLISWPARSVRAGQGSLDTIVALDRN